MAFKIYIKDNIGNMIHQHLNGIPKIIEVQNLTITDGMLIKGNYRIPIDHILFIQEII